MPQLLGIDQIREKMAELGHDVSDLPDAAIALAAHNFYRAALRLEPHPVARVLRHPERSESHSWGCPDLTPDSELEDGVWRLPYNS